MDIEEDFVEIKITDCGIDAIKNNKFRVRNKKLFLTYSGLHNKRDLFEWFITNIGELKYYKIANETYSELNENGESEYHTHFLLEFLNKPDIKNVNAFDYLEHHPNVKRVSSTFHFINAIKYLDKEDPSPFTNIRLNDIDTNQELHDLYETIQNHNNWKDVMNDKTIRKQIFTKLNWAKEVFNARPKRKITSKLKFQDLVPYQKELYLHLRDNEPVSREIIWCYSEQPKQGKSIFKMFLQSKLELLSIDFQSNKISMNDIVNVYDDEDIIVFDLPWNKSKSLEERLKSSFEEGEEKYSSNTFLDTLELLSNKGQEFTSVKYMGRKITINAHILVFSNCPPTYIKEVLPDRIKVVEAKL